MKKVRLLIIFICFALMFLGLIFLGILYNIKTRTEIDYCIELENRLEDLTLKQFDYCSTRYWDEKMYGEQLIGISFELKDYDKYHKDNAINEINSDIVKIKTEITEFLKDNPDNELNTKNIKCYFDELPGDSSCIYNYNYISDEKLPEPDGFYYYGMALNILNADLFKDAKVMSIIRVNNADELRLLEDWNNLEYVSLYGMEFSEQDKDYLRRILPDTVILCNSEEI